PRHPDPCPVSTDLLIAHIRKAYAAACDLEKLLHREHAHLAPPLAFPLAARLGNLHEELVQQFVVFLSLCNHPSATQPIHNLPLKYKIPARLWDTGILAYLDLLRPHLPDTKDQMSTFILHVYGNLTTLVEMNLLFDWSETLGDLSRYRVAIEHDDPEDRDHWADIAKEWYLKGVERKPEKGRLWHHLAILESDWQKIINYTKSLFARKPFSPSKESILTVFDPSLSTDQVPCTDPLYNSFIAVLKALFLRIELDDFDAVVDDFILLFDSSNWNRVQQVLFITISALWNFGAPTSKLYIQRQMSSCSVELHSDDVFDDDDILPPLASSEISSVPENPHAQLQVESAIDIVLEKSSQFLFEILDLACQHSSKEACGAIYMCLRHMHYLATYGLLHLIEHAVKWNSLLEFLNSVVTGREIDDGCTSDPMDEEFKGMVVEYLQSTGSPLSQTEKIVVLAKEITQHYDGLVFDVVGVKFKTTSTLSVRLLQRELETQFISSRDSESEEEEHVVCNIDDEQNVQGESEAIRQLRERRRELRAILGQKEQSRITKIKAVGKKIRFGKIVPRATILMFDTNILVSHLDILKAAVDSGNWTIVVPLIVITELDGLKNSADPLGPSSVNAISTIEAYLHAHRVRVVTHKGNALNTLFFRSEDLNFSAEEGKRGTIDDKIIDAAITQKQKNTLCSEKANIADSVESVVLVTGDRNMRIIATARGIKTLSPSGAKREVVRKRNG
ncbi:Telomerase-binding protein EST1A, partial [Neolecta irregularis DAH-3]